MVSFLKMMINTVGAILNVVTLCISSLTCLAVLIICIVIIHHLVYTRVQQENKIVLSICLSIYLITLGCLVIIVSFNIQTLLGDLYEKNANSPWCISISYVFIVLFGGLLWTFTNQVLNRKICLFLLKIYFLGFLSSLSYCISNLSISTKTFTLHHIAYI